MTGSGVAPWSRRATRSDWCSSPKVRTPCLVDTSRNAPGMIGQSCFRLWRHSLHYWVQRWPIRSMYAIYGNIYHQYTSNVSIYTIHGSYGWWFWEERIVTVLTIRILARPAAKFALRPRSSCSDWRRNIRILQRPGSPWTLGTALPVDHGWRFVPSGTGGGQVPYWGYAKCYPLVMTNKKLWKDPPLWMGKSTINGPFSIAT